MTSRQGEQGTGKHPHKDTEEPYPHTRDSSGHERSGDRGGSGQQREASSEREPGQGGSSGGEDLRRREYKDEKGETNHHTKPYTEEHGKK